ncbi:hypothetical protein FHS85_004594 [Rhodoligotrophos appendicifer]|uniref:hypothetical protein n=1 Tax=Rhodoligotrophos appendicifer TaxID=987056 RepID=UPI0011857C9A|nr:hypothetical protein [Rhodoligotrophos appendicifer]
MRFLIAIALATSLAGGSALAADRTEVIKFAPGKTADTVRSSIRGYDGVTYSIATAAGQVMQILFAPSNRSCYFNVYAPGKEIGTDEAAFIGSTSGNEFGINPTEAGTYTAQVYLMRNAARRNEVCRFELSIEITGAPGGASAGVSDQSMIDICKASAAPLYGVNPRNVSVAGPVTEGEDGGFRIDGTVDKGAEGIKGLRCLYGADRQFTHIQAMTSDGE